MKSSQVSALVIVLVVAVALGLCCFFLLGLSLFDSVKDEEDIRNNDDTQSSEYFTNYMPVKYRYGNYQKVGQTFMLDQRTVVNLVELQGSYGLGEIANLYIVETSDPDDDNLDNIIASGEFVPEDIIKEEKFNVILDRPVELDPFVTYFLWIEVPDERTEANIGFVEANIYDEGKMYLFTRLTGGNGGISDPNHSWQPRNSNDLIFEFK